MRLWVFISGTNPLLLWKLSQIGWFKMQYILVSYIAMRRIRVSKLNINSISIQFSSKCGQHCSDVSASHKSGLVGRKGTLEFGKYSQLLCNKNLNHMKLN